MPKRFDKTDFFALICVAISIALSSAIFIKSSSIQPINRTETHPIGTIDHISGEVNRRSQNSLVWETAKNGDHVYDNDLISTGERSRVTITLNTQESIELSSSSLIKISNQISSLNIELFSGMLNATAINDGSKELNDRTITIHDNKHSTSISRNDLLSQEVKQVVRRPNQSILTQNARASRRSNQRHQPSAIQEDNKHSVDQVNKGFIWVSSHNKNLLHSKKQKITLDLTNTRAIYVRIYKGQDNSPHKIIRLDKIRRQHFERENYTLELSSLEPGEYTAIQTNHNNQPISMYQSFTIANYQKIKHVKPTKNEIFDLYWDESVNITWEGRDNIDYIIKITDPREKTSIYKVNTPQLFFKPRMSGQHRFKIKVDHEKTQFSKSHDFYVSLKQHQIINWTMKKNQDFLLDPVPFTSRSHLVSWETQYPNYEVFIELSRDNEFIDTILRKEVLASKRHFNFSINNPGKYYFRIRPTKNFSYITASDTGVAHYFYPDISQPLPLRNQILHEIPTRGERYYRVELPTNSFTTEYNLQISRDPEFNRLLLDRASRINRFEWVSNESGKLYYRYRVTDAIGRRSLYSNTAILYFPISPLIEIDESE